MYSVFDEEDEDFVGGYGRQSAHNSAKLVAVREHRQESRDHFGDLLMASFRTALKEASNFRIPL
jgi:hypothetical protein